MKRIISLVVCVALLASLAIYAGAVDRKLQLKSISGEGKTLLSASDYWSMGSGWMDCSTDSMICFENTTDKAGPNIYTPAIAGNEGFTIRYTVDFLDPTVQTTAGTTLRLASDTMTYFDLRATGRGNEALFEVNYCDGGTWSTVVPLVTGLPIHDSRLTVQIKREAAHNEVEFSLFDADNNEIFSRRVSAKAWSGNRFLDRGDLQFLFKPYEGYGCFRISDYSLEDCPDDGIEPPKSASDVWNLGGNWNDDSTEDSVIISNAIQNAGPSFFSEKIDAGEAFRIGFLYTGKSDYTTADITLRRTDNNSVYIRMLVTQNNGTALVDVNFYDGANWTALASTGWISDAGSSYGVTLEHKAGADALRLVLTKTDGTLIGDWEFANPVCTNANFFGASSLEALVTTCGDYGLFSIADFTLHASANEAAAWTASTNWTGSYTDDGQWKLTNVIQNAGPIFYREAIDPAESFRLGFRYEGESDYTTADITLRRTDNNAVYLRMLVTQSSGTALVDVNFFDGANWTALASTGWISDVGSAYDFYLSHDAGSNAMTLTLKKTDGTTFFSQTFENAVCTSETFFSAPALEALVTTCGDYGIFSVTGFRVEHPQSIDGIWTLGNGWADANGYDAPAIRNTTDTGAAPAFFTETIDVSNGLCIDFDFTTAVKEMQTTAEFVLRQTRDNSRYLRMVVTGRGTQEAIVELSYFDGANWTALDSTGWLSHADLNGSYHVRLTHQAGTSVMKMTLTAADGVFYEKEFTSEVLDLDGYWSGSLLQALFNPIGGYGCFTIADFTVDELPAETVETDLWQLGNGWKAYADGDGLRISKEDTQQTEAVYTTRINGQQGFRVSFDISFASLSTSSCAIKLRIPTEQEIYLFARVKGDNNQTILEAQAYDSTAENEWTGSLLSSSASRWTANNGTVTVVLERQAMREEMRFCAIDKLTGETLIDETFSNERLSASRFLDYNGLEWIFGTDAGSAGFSIRNFTVEPYNADPIAVESVQLNGSTECTAGETVRYSATIEPSNATVKSCTWQVNGTAAGSGTDINWIFSEAGEYTLTLRVEDYSGNVIEKELTVTVAPAPVVYAAGDINADGTVNADDAQLLADHLSGKAPLAEEELARADINGDGEADLTDLYEILSGKEASDA